MYIFHYHHLKKHLYSFYPYILLAVAGAGKTTEIIEKVNYDDKTLIITYTESNYNNIKKRIINKFKEIPSI